MLLLCTIFSIKIWLFVASQGQFGTNENFSPRKAIESLNSKRAPHSLYSESEYSSPKSNYQRLIEKYGNYDFKSRMKKLGSVSEQAISDHFSFIDQMQPQVESARPDVIRKSQNVEFSHSNNLRPLQEMQTSNPEYHRKFQPMESSKLANFEKVRNMDSSRPDSYGHNIQSMPSSRTDFAGNNGQMKYEYSSGQISKGRSQIGNGKIPTLDELKSRLERADHMKEELLSNPNGFNDKGFMPKFFSEGKYSTKNVPELTNKVMSKIQEPVYNALQSRMGQSFERMDINDYAKNAYNNFNGQKMSNYNQNSRFQNGFQSRVYDISERDHSELNSQQSFGSSSYESSEESEDPYYMRHTSSSQQKTKGNFVRKDARSTGPRQRNDDTQQHFQNNYWTI